jgi:hypothetical protein
MKHFHRLAICPVAILDRLEQLWNPSDAAGCIKSAESIVHSIKLLMKDLYHLTPKLDAPLSIYAHATHGTIEDDEVKLRTPLDW